MSVHLHCLISTHFVVLTMWYYINMCVYQDVNTEVQNLLSCLLWHENKLLITMVDVL